MTRQNHPIGRPVGCALGRIRVWTTSRWVAIVNYMDGTTRPARRRYKTRGVRVNGHAVRAVRIHAGLSQVELATQARMSPQHLSNVEHGRQAVVNARMLQAIAEALAVDVRAFTADLVAA